MPVSRRSRPRSSRSPAIRPRGRSRTVMATGAPDGAHGANEPDCRKRQDRDQSRSDDQGRAAALQDQGWEVSPREPMGAACCPSPGRPIAAARRSDARSRGSCRRQPVQTRGGRSATSPAAASRGRSALRDLRPELPGRSGSMGSECGEHRRGSSCPGTGAGRCRALMSFDSQNR